MVLQKLKADVEHYLEKPVTEVLIKVPAFFTDVRRQVTKDMGTIAGLDIFRMTNVYSDARHLSKNPTGFSKKPNRSVRLTPMKLLL